MLTSGYEIRGILKSNSELSSGLEAAFFEASFFQIASFEASSFEAASLEGGSFEGRHFEGEGLEGGMLEEGNLEECSLEGGNSEGGSLEGGKPYEFIWFGDEYFAHTGGWDISLLAFGDDLISALPCRAAAPEPSALSFKK